MSSESKNNETAVATAEEWTVHLSVPSNPGSPRVPLKINKDLTSTVLRRKVGEATKIPIGSLRLIFRGRMISDDDTLAAVDEFRMEDGCVLHCMGKPEVQQQQSSSSSAAVVSGSSVSVREGNSSSTTTAAVSQPTLTTRDPLEIALNTLRSSNSQDAYLTGVTTLGKILGNITSNPMEEKYRQVKRRNAAFQRRLGGLTGGDDVMKAAGFVTEQQQEEEGGEEIYMMQASAEAWPKLMATKASVDRMVQDAQRQQQQQQQQQQQFPSPQQGMGMGIPPNFPGGGAGMPNLPPHLQQAAANFMSDPNAVRNMLQNPMVQQMMQNDPRFANNPMLRQSLEQVASNPEMLNQLSHMMSDPANVSRLTQMMGQQSQTGAMPSLGGGMPPLGQQVPPNTSGAAGTAPNSNNNNNNSRSDESTTEEEMIAEAIRRSLQEGN